MSPRAICVTVVHVDTLLGDATLRAGAQRVAAEIAAMPGPDSAVAHLQALTHPLATES